MPFVVHRYSGSLLVESASRTRVAERVAQARRSSDGVVAVVSTTPANAEHFLLLAREICESPSERERHLLTVCSAQITATLLAMAIHAHGAEAHSLFPHQLAIQVETDHGIPRIAGVDARAVLRELASGAVVVVAAAEGIDRQGNITSLGEGGADASAMALAVAVGAGHCEIYAETDGVYTADPGIVDGARQWPQVSYGEILELASIGARLVHPRAIEIAQYHRLPVLIRSLITATGGTWVRKEPSEMEPSSVTRVSLDPDQARISVRGLSDRPEAIAMLFDYVARQHIEVDMIVQNVGREGTIDVSFTVPKPLAAMAEAVTREAGVKSGATVSSERRMAKVSIVGSSMQYQWGVAAKMFATLAAAKITIHMIGTSAISISCVIDDRYGELAVRELDAAFNRRAEGPPAPLPMPTARP